jgi:hypothetical protein
MGGRPDDSTRNFHGDLAELAAWDAVLTQNEISELASGVSPLSVRPGSLKNYVPLVRGVEDVVYGSHSSTTGTTVSAHPPVIYGAPSAPVVVSDVPRVISVSTDDDVLADEDPWTIVGTRFGAR